MSTRTATKGDTVRIRYALRVDNQLVETNEQGEALTITLGEGKVIRGFEQAVEGMREGETKRVTLTPAEAYGEHREELVQKIPKTALEGNPAVGMHIQARDPNTGAVFTGIITRMDDDTLTVDFNHPLAGKELVFDITLEAILPAEGDE